MQTTTQARIALASLALLALPQARAEDTIKVGEYASLTGKEASFGQSSHKGIVMAIEEINAAGGVLGRQFELFTEDNQTIPGQSATAAKKLISRDKVVALLGEVSSGRSLEAAPIAQAARMPMIAPAATNPKVTQVGNYIFRVCFIDPFQGTVMAKFAKDRAEGEASRHRLERIQRLQRGPREVLHGEIRRRRRRDRRRAEVLRGRQGLQGPADRHQARPAVDAVFVPGYYTEAALIVRQARELGLTMPFLGGDGWVASQLLEIGGDALNGCYYSTHFSPENDNADGQEVRDVLQGPLGRRDPRRLRGARVRRGRRARRRHPARRHDGRAETARCARRDEGLQRGDGPDDDRREPRCLEARHDHRDPGREAQLLCETVAP